MTGRGMLVRLLCAPIVAFACCAMMAIRGGAQLASISGSGDRLPLWDMAQNGVAGLRLAAAVGDLDPLAWLLSFNELSVWPPIYPLLEMPVFMLWGYDYRVPRLLQVALWCSAIFSTWWALRPLGLESRPAGGVPGDPASPRHPATGDAVGLLTASCFAAGPFFAGFATVNMLEIPGLLCLTVCVGCYLRALAAERSPAATRWWRATWLASLVLFLCKYNYGLLWLVPVAISESRRRLGSWAAIGAFSVQLARRARWRDPGLIAGALLLLSMAVIRLTGGFEGQVAGFELRATSIGGPAYALFLLVIWRLATPWRSFLGRLRGPADRGPADRELLRCLVAPVCVWMLIPPHLKDFVDFVENRAAGPALGSWPWLSFYPRLTFEVYGSVAIGAVVGVLSIVGTAVMLRRRQAEHRLVVICLGVWAVALLLHPYKLPRFAFSAFWWLAVAAALGATALLRGGCPGRWSRRITLAVAAAVATATALAGVATERVLLEHRLRTVDPEAREVLAVITDPARRSAGLTVIGTWNRLSPHLIEWQARIRDAAEGGGSPLPELDFELAHGRAHRLLSRLQQQQGGLVVILDRARDAEFSRETAWLGPVRQWIHASPDLRLLEVREAGGYSVSFFELMPPLR